MELAGLSFLDSPGSGSLRFLEPNTLRAQALLRKPLTLKTQTLRKKAVRKNTCDYRVLHQQTRFAEQIFETCDYTP